MLTKEEMQSVFQNKYNRVKWCDLLSCVFDEKVDLSSSKPKKIAEVKDSYELGEIEVENRKIKIYEVILAGNIDLEKNRIGVRNMMKKYWKHNDGSFIVYHTLNKPEKWRFSYIQETNIIDEKGKIGTIQTDPKRYTYLLGERENVRTITERFEKLNSKSTVKDIKEAFSVEKLSDEFFEKYKECYGNLVEFFTAENYIRKDGKYVLAKKPDKIPDESLKWFFNGNEKSTRDFCKKTLGQIVFLYFVQKKGWLNEEIDFMKKNYYNKPYESLRELFFNALNTERPKDIFKLPDSKSAKIPFLNGGLFENDHPSESCPIIPQKLLNDFFDFLEQYNFTINENTVDSEQTVGIDPEMLSKIFENLLEDNKEKGAYYTPKEIVKYMCEESLIEYLVERTKIEREKVEGLVKNLLPIEEDVNKINSALDNVKICDPAIGSGAFPMGMLNLIFNIKETLNPTIDRTKTKLGIIQNSIYGVDVEKGAVDIARLRFWLSLIIDEEKPEPLPNLDFKIVQGDSLVSKFENEVINIDWDILNDKKGSLYKDYANKLKEKFDELVGKQKDFFYESDKGQKEKLRAKVRNLKIAILENQIKLEQKEYTDKNMESNDNDMFGLSNRNVMRNLEIKTKKNDFKNILEKLEKLKNDNKKSLNFFDWHLDFPEIMNSELVQKRVGLNGTFGFDIVIGNPPYIFARNSKSKGLTKEDKNYFYKNYKLSEYQINLYPLFIEVGSNMLKNKGQLVYITPNNWLTLNTNQKLRRFVLEQSNITILNFYKRVFESADVDAAIILFSKNNGSIKEKIKLAEWEKEYALIGEIEKEKFLSNNDCVINIEALKGNETFSLLDKIESNTIPLSNFAKVKCGLGAYGNGDGIPPQTKEMIKNRIYHSKNKKGNDWYKYIEGEDVKRYECTWNKQEYLKYGKHLREPRNDWNLFSTSRVLVRQIPSPLPYCINACYTEELLLNDRNSMNIIYIKISPLYLLGILNSRLISYWFAHKFGKLQRGIFPQFKINELAQFPIPNVPNEQQQPIIALVNQILSVKKENPQTDTSDLEKKIDKIVYKLYGLTGDEIKMIED